MTDHAGPEIDRATFMLAATKVSRALGTDQDAQDTLNAVVRYVGRLEQAIDTGGGWDHV